MGRIVLTVLAPVVETARQTASFGALVHLLDRIDNVLADNDKAIGHADFERFALGRLGQTYPTLAPISGGSDWGRDGDIFDPEGGPPTRLLATSSRNLAGVRNNMHSGLKSLAAHEQTVERVVLVNLAQLSAADLAKLEKTAASYEVSILAHHGRQWVADQLRVDGGWRQRLLGIPGDPVGVARLPPELADSQWSRLPLVGRDEEMEELLSDRTRDIVVSGLPGCGKSRLLSELDDVVFVDRDVAIEVVLDDLRMLRPNVVVVDDAFDRRSSLRQIALVRRQEPDLLTFRILAVCWPDEVEALLDDLRTARHVALDLLEQTYVDQIIQAMGIKRLIPRHEILRQAEGRPGWAIALGDLLVSSRDATDLLNGRALRGEVHRYLRRRNLAEAIVPLAVIAALGGVGEDEREDLAQELQITRSELARQLSGAARSGLVDIGQSWTSGRTQRSYRVRPPMLAYGLVAECVFEADVPNFDLEQLADRWPEHLAAIATAAVEAARLDVKDARTVAERLYNRAMDELTVRSAGGPGLANSFGSLDRDAARHVLDRLVGPFDLALAADHSNPAYLVSPFVSVAVGLASWRLPQTVHLVLDAALVDHREAPSSFPNHPLREISELITKFHPELPTVRAMPAFLAEAAASWLGDGPDERRWLAWAHVAAAAINPRRSGAFTDPGQPMSVTFYETVASIDESAEVEGEAWPHIVGLLAEAPSVALAVVLRSVELWLQIGAGFDQPFGSEHPAELVENAARVGRRLFSDLVPHVQGHPGVSARARSIAKRCSVDIVLPVPLPLSAFLIEPASAGEWRRDHTATTARIHEAVDGWARDVPSAAVGRLVDVRRELEIAGERWPSAVRIACEAIAQHAEELAPWLDASLDLGLFPEAEPFVTAYRRRQGALSPALIGRAMAEPSARFAVIRSVLSDVDAETSEVRYVVERLGASDGSLLEELTHTDDLRDRVREVLVEAAPVVRAAMAVAMAAELIVDEDWTPGDLEAEWLCALDEVGQCASDHAENDLFRFLARHHPDRLIELLQAALPANDDDIWSGHGPSQAMLDALEDLPPGNKVGLLGSDLGRAARGRILDGILGPDLEWLPEAIDGGLLTVDEAIDHLGRLNRRPPFEDIARLAIPRGVDPERVAHLALSGSWTGDRSNWFQSSADMFGQMAESDEADVAAVGRAGQEHFLQMAAEARREEKRQRILGHR